MRNPGFPLDLEKTLEKMTVLLEKSWDFVIFNKNPEKMIINLGQNWQTTNF